MTILTVLFIAGMLIMFCSCIWIIVLAFRTHIGWGLACLLLPISQWVYVATHWKGSWKAFASQMLGFGIMLSIGPIVDKSSKATVGDTLTADQYLQSDMEKLPKTTAATIVEGIPTTNVVGIWKVMNVREGMVMPHLLEYEFADDGVVTFFTQEKERPETFDTFRLPYKMSNEWLVILTEEGGVHSQYRPFMHNGDLVLEPPEYASPLDYYRMTLTRINVPTRRR